MKNNPSTHYDVALYAPDDPFRWVGHVNGPAGSPYKGGVFQLSIDFPTGYPFTPPSIAFITKIYNPMVDNYGRVCLDVLRLSWSPGTTIRHVLDAVVDILVSPAPGPAVINTQIAKVFKNDTRPGSAIFLLHYILYHK